MMNLQRAKRLEKKEDLIEVELENGAVLKSKTVIISTGARWRNIDVPGEEGIPKQRGRLLPALRRTDCLPVKTLQSSAAETPASKRPSTWPESSIMSPSLNLCRS